MKHFFIALVLVTLAQPSTAAIETVIAPNLTDGSLEILRWSLFHDGDTVKYGRCDTLEPECNPEIPSFTLSRELNYNEFLNALAMRFRVPAKYLIKHDAAIASYRAYSDTLTAIRDNMSLPREESDTARMKLEILTVRGGILDRFLQAVAIKRSLEWAKNDEEAKQLTASFGETGKLASLVVRAEGNGGSRGTFRDFLTYLSDHQGATEPVRLKASKLRAEIQRLEKSGPSVARSLDEPFKVLMEGGRAGRAKAIELESYLNGISGISDAVDGDLSDAYDEFSAHLGDYRKSLVAINKVGLDEAPVVPAKQVITFEKSVRQFEQALWPMNFAEEKSGGPAARIEEPSTGKTWVFVGNQLTYAEANVACEQLGRGYSLPELSRELTYSAPWLVKSKLADQVAGTNEKKVWVKGAISSLGRHKGSEQRMVGSQYYKVQKTVQIHHYDYRFPLAVLQARPVETSLWVTTGGEDNFGSEEAYRKFANETPKAPALCVGPTKFQ